MHDHVYILSSFQNEISDYNPLQWIIFLITLKKGNQLIVNSMIDRELKIENTLFVFFFVFLFRLIRDFI
jgi:hypothetical protein